MSLAERRIEQRRAVVRGGRRMDDWMPGRPCGCAPPPVHVGAGRQFEWFLCSVCGAVWSARIAGERELEVERR